jgi:hypothetical protein
MSALDFSPYRTRPLVLWLLVLAQRALVVSQLELRLWLVQVQIRPVCVWLAEG